MGSRTNSSKISVSFSAVLVLLLSALCSGPLRAQVVGGTISGTVSRQLWGRGCQCHGIAEEPGDGCDHRSHHQ